MKNLKKKDEDLLEEDEDLLEKTSRVGLLFEVEDF